MTQSKKRLARIGIIAAAFVMCLALGVAAWAAITMKDAEWSAGGKIQINDEFGIDVTAAICVTTDASDPTGLVYGNPISATDNEIDLDVIELFPEDFLIVEITMDASALSFDVTARSLTYTIVTESAADAGAVDYCEIAGDDSDIIDAATEYVVYIVINANDAADWETARADKGAFTINISFELA